MLVVQPDHGIFVQARLEGIGYREQELQLAKGSNFASELPRGISWASFGGGTNIFIKGDGLMENPQSNTPMLYSVDLDVIVPCPPLTEDDAFGSNTVAGFLSYRLPSLPTLLQVDMEMLDQYEFMIFELRLFVDDDLLGPQTLTCDTVSYCQIYFKKSTTPVVYEIAPPVVYYGSDVFVWFDPKSTTSLIEDLPTDEMPFINAKIGGNLIDFEFNVDFDTYFSHWQRNSVKGVVGDQQPAANHDISMLWETGQSVIQPQESVHCSYDNSTCYTAKTVPVIFGKSSATGYTTGG